MGRTVVVSSIASIFALGFAHPFEVAKTNIQLRAANKRNYLADTFGILKEVVETKNFRGL